MSRILVLSSAAFVLAACGSTSPGTGTKLYTSKADGETVECRRIQEMGSRLGKRVCMKPIEWEQADAAAEQAAKDQINRNNQRGVAPDGGGGGIGG